MKHQLREEIEKLIEQLSQKTAELTDQQLYERLLMMYEKSVLLQHQKSEPLGDKDLLGKQQNQLFDDLESMSIEKSAPISVEKSHQEEIPELMDTIKNMVTEMPESKELNELFTQLEEPSFVRKEDKPQSDLPKDETNLHIEKPSPNINERFSKGLKVDLNDRLAFIQHLFDNQPNEYQRAMGQLVTYNSLAEATQFIDQMLKPDYNGWEGKEAYEERFLNILTQFFDTK